MPWSTSNRKARLPRDWEARRQFILARDGNRCTAVDSLGNRCPERATDVDHIKAGDDASYSNLRALCRWHHARKSSAEGLAARRAKGGYRRQAREPEPHPLAKVRHIPN